MAIRNGRPATRHRLPNTIEERDVYLADVIDDCRRELLGEISDLRDEVRSTRRTLWVFVGSLFTMSGGLVAVAAMLA